MKMVFSKWVPRFLTMEQTQQRVDDSESCLSLFTRNKQDFLRGYVAMDETWIHHFTPELKRQSAEWHGMQPVKAVWSVRKRNSQLAKSWRQFLGCARYNLLPWKGKVYQQRLLHWVIGAFEGRNRKKTTAHEEEKIIFHQDNAPCHKSMKTMAKLAELGYKLLPHPPYSPDLAPSDH